MYVIILMLLEMPQYNGVRGEYLDEVYGYL